MKSWEIGKADMTGAGWDPFTLFGDAKREYNEMNRKFKSQLKSYKSKPSKQKADKLLTYGLHDPIRLKYEPDMLQTIIEILNEYPDLWKDHAMALFYAGIKRPTQSSAQSSTQSSVIEAKATPKATPKASTKEVKRVSTEDVMRALVKVQVEDYLADKSADNAEAVLDALQSMKEKGFSIAQYKEILTDIKKRYPEMENPENDIIVDMTETVATSPVAKPKTKRQRKPMTQEQKAALTERLRLAREAKRAQKALEESALYDTMGRKWEFGMDFNNDGTIEDDEKVEGITHDYVYVCKSAIFMRYVREIESGEYGDLTVRPMTKAGLFRISIPPATLDEAVRKMRTSEMEFIDSGNTYAEAIEKARISDSQLKRIFRLAVRMSFERQTQ